MDINAFLQGLVDALIPVDGLQAIVLGGLLASGTQRPDSDIDLGLYYSEEAPLDIYHLRKIATDLNDFPNLAEFSLEVATKAAQNGNVFFVLDGLLGAIGDDSHKLKGTLTNTESLLAEVIELCRGQYTARFDLGALSPKRT